MLERLRLGRRKEIDPRQIALQEVLDRVEAGPQMVGLRHGVLDSYGELAVPQGLEEDPQTGEARMEYSLSLPFGPKQEDGTTPSTTLSVGALQSGTGEQAVYIASDGQRVLQADPHEEGLVNRIRTELNHQVAKRIEDRRLPSGLLASFSPVRSGS